MGAPHRWARMGTCYHSLVNTLLFWQAQVIHPAHGCVSARSSCCRPRSQLVIARSAHAKYPIDDGWTRRVLSRVLACITLPPGEVVLFVGGPDPPLKLECRTLNRVLGGPDPALTSEM
eukprot:1356097-Pyramimonas_sp.AAC.1